MGSARSLLALATLAATLLLMLANAGSASAYSVNRDATVPWPFDTITFYVADDAQYRGPILRAMRSWNNRDAGYTFRRTGDANAANIVFFENVFPGESEDKCTGSTIQGFGFAQSFVILGGEDCDPYVMTLASAHEVGHVLTLNHENDTCALMNSRGFANVANPRLARPSACPRGRQYYRAPVRADDAAGGRAARRRPFRFAPALCFEADGTFQSQLTANELLCNFQYDCRGQAGANPNGNPSDAELIGRGCERSEYPRPTSKRSAKVAVDLGHSHGSAHHAFGESPGVETFGSAR